MTHNIDNHIMQNKTNKYQTHPQINNKQTKYNNRKNSNNKQIKNKSVKKKVSEQIVGIHGKRNYKYNKNKINKNLIQTIKLITKSDNLSKSLLEIFFKIKILIKFLSTITSNKLKNLKL